MKMVDGLHTLRCSGLVVHGFVSCTCPTAAPHALFVSYYSDHRFNLLFRAVDSIGGDGMVEQEDLVEFMFPGNAKEEAAQGPAGKHHTLCLTSMPESDVNNEKCVCIDVCVQMRFACSSPPVRPPMGP
jgi:hypothetical protein